jgi:E3 ubiquitin-protein ligase FANCL
MTSISFVFLFDHSIFRNRVTVLRSVMFVQQARAHNLGDLRCVILISKHTHTTMAMSEMSRSGTTGGCFDSGVEPQPPPSSSSQQTTIITSIDPPVCTNIDCTSDDTLVLTGNAQYSVNLDTLSVLRRWSSCGSSRAEEYKAVSLFPQKQQQPPQDPLAISLQRIRGLKDRLDKLVRRQTSFHQEQSLIRFRSQCDDIFGEIRNALRIRDQQNNTAVTVMDTPKDAVLLTSRYARHVTQQLTALEEAFCGTSSSPILELSKDCRTVTLQYTDGGQRLHTILFDLGAETMAARTVCDDYFSFARQSDPIRVGSKKRRRNDSNQEACDESDHTAAVDLVQVYRLFRSRVDSYQSLYSELEDLDTNCQVLDEVLSPWTVPYRRLRLTDQASVVVTVADVERPTLVPKFQWLGSGRDVDVWRSRFDGAAWKEGRSLLENLDTCCGAHLPRKCDSASTNAMKSQQDTNSGTDCAICYSEVLVDEATNGVAEAHPGLQCENATCGRRYHEACLRQWLYSLSTSRISFDLVIGSCPYCKQPITAPMLLA